MIERQRVNILVQHLCDGTDGLLLRFYLREVFAIFVVSFVDILDWDGL